MEVKDKAYNGGCMIAAAILVVGLAMSCAIMTIRPSGEDRALTGSEAEAHTIVNGTTNKNTLVNNNTDCYTVVNNSTNLYTVVNNNTNFYTVVNNISITNIPYAELRLSDRPEIVEEDGQSSAMAALFAINHVNWVVTKIKNYNDPMVLEEEYKNISADALNLNAIKDHEVIDLICDIMDVITDMRIEEKEREFLKEELDQGMSDALYSAFSGIGTGGGITPVAAVFNLVTSAATAAISYKRAKRQLMMAHKKKMWGLDKNRMQYLNELNKSLLQKYWVIVQRYNLPDEFRVSEQDISLLIDHLKDENPKRLHDFLVAVERKYCGLQNYWYYRGLAAYQSDDFVDASKSLDSYRRAREKYGAMLRIDGIAAKAAMLRVRLMIADDENSQKQGKHKVWDDNSYREQLAIIEKNSTIEEWQSFYFCALVYSHYLKNPDIVAADKVLAPIIVHLEYKRDRRLIDWQDLVVDMKETKSTNAVERLVQSGDALFECKKLLANEAKVILGAREFEARIAKICDDENASAREKIFCYGDLSYKKALEKIVPDLRNMRVVREKDNTLKLLLPMSWVMSREGDSHLGLYESEKNYLNDIGRSALQEKKEENEDERTIDEGGDRPLVCVNFGEYKKIGDAKKIVYTVRYDHVDKTGKGVEKSYMVAVVFDVKDRKQLMPSKAHFGPWVVGVGKAPSGWKLKPRTSEPDIVTKDL